MAKPLDLGLVLGLNHGMGSYGAQRGGSGDDPDDMFGVTRCHPKDALCHQHVCTPDSQMITLDSPLDPALSRTRQIHLVLGLFPGLFDGVCSHGTPKMDDPDDMSGDDMSSGGHICQSKSGAPKITILTS